jgi:hypothetical protein
MINQVSTILDVSYNQKTINQSCILIQELPLSQDKFYEKIIEKSA